MKKIFQILVCVTLTIAFVSCKEQSKDRGLSSEETPTGTSVPMAVDSSKAIAESSEKAVHDSIERIKEVMADLNTKTDSLGENTKSLTAKIEKLQPSSLDTILKWGSAVAALLALVLSVLALYLIYVPGKVSDDLEDKIGHLNSEINKLRDEVSINPQGMSSVQSRDIEDRLRVLEGKVASVEIQIKKSTQANPQNTNISVKEQQSARRIESGPKVVYAGTNTGDYLVEISDSRQESSVFSIEFRNETDTKGEFTIISLDKIRSRNGWQHIVECSGCSINDATRFSLEGKGVCEKVDTTTLKVTKKLKIKLYR